MSRSAKKQKPAPAVPATAPAPAAGEDAPSKPIGRVLVRTYDADGNLVS